VRSMTVCRCVAGLPVCSRPDEAGMASIPEMDGKDSEGLGGSCRYVAGLSACSSLDEADMASIFERDGKDSEGLGGSRLWPSSGEESLASISENGTNESGEPDGTRPGL
jgi:hypothetical protein